MRALQKLKPKKDTFFLHWPKLTQAEVLRKAIRTLPVHLHPQKLEILTPYWFKSVLASVLLHAQVAPNVVCHYLKHTLSQRDLQALAHKMQFNLGETSAKYAISTDQLPSIRIKLQLFWSTVELLC